MQGLQYVPCFVRVSRSVCRVERTTEAAGVRERGDEKGAWSWEGGNDRRPEKVTEYELNDLYFSPNIIWVI